MTTTDESRPVEQEPNPINWKAWLSLPRVALWEGVALVHDIDPRSLRLSSNGWMAGPGNVFEPGSFPSASKRPAFDDAMGWAERAAGYGDSSLIRLDVGFVYGPSYCNAEVSLTEVVAFFVGMDWPGIPAPLLDAMKRLAAAANTQASEPAPAVARVAVDVKPTPDGARSTVQVVRSVIGVVRHSTRPKRRNILDPVIELAQSLCSDPADTMQVYAHLQVMAEEDNPPLLASTPDGLKYSNNGKDAYLTKEALDRRLHPEKRKSRR